MENQKGNLTHNCLEIIQYQTKIQEDLAEQALLEEERICVYVYKIYGSSKCLQREKEC